MLTFWAYLRLHLLLWALRAAWRMLRWLVTAAILIAAAPITIVAAVAYAGAWLRGWPPARLWRAAAWALPMTGVYLAAHALHATSWRAPAHPRTRWPGAPTSYGPSSATGRASGGCSGSSAPPGSTTCARTT
jgi:hypothetical protein